MACLLTTGYTIDCKDGVGGLRKLYVARLDDVASVTIATGTNIVSTITKDTSLYFFTYELHKETSSINEDITPSENGALFYTQKLNFEMRKMLAASRNELRLLAQNRLLFVAEDRNGKFWLLGWDTNGSPSGLEMVTSTATSGTAMGDMNGYKLNFEGKTELPMFEVSSACAATLTTPGA